MILASDLKSGILIHEGQELFRVVDSTYHKGGGKSGSMVHARVENLKTGHLTERRFSPDQKLDDLHLEKRSMEFLYHSGDEYWFMDSTTYEQISLSKEQMGPPVRFLKEGVKIPIGFYEGKPLEILFPSAVEIRVSQTAPGLKGQQDSTYKTAVLENGMEVLVPQFIENGDLIRVEVQTGKYQERVKTEKLHK